MVIERQLLQILRVIKMARLSFDLSSNTNFICSTNAKTPMQHNVNQMKPVDSFFLFLLQTQIDCGFLLEPPHVVGCEVMSITL